MLSSKVQKLFLLVHNWRRLLKLHLPDANCKMDVFWILFVLISMCIHAVKLLVCVCTGSGFYKLPERWGLQRNHLPCALPKHRQLHLCSPGFKRGSRRLSLNSWHPSRKMRRLIDSWHNELYAETCFFCLMWCFSLGRDCCCS